MSVLTENELKKILKDKDLNALKEIEVNKRQIITPSAISFLNDHNISLKYVENIEGVNIQVKSEDIKKIENEIKNVKNKYVTIFGVGVNEKPEHMTHLYGNVLVFKDHKRIELRGKLDSVEAKILEAQIVCHKEKVKGLVEDLEEVIDFVRNLIRCEVLEEPLGNFLMLGMDEAELRDKSHHTTKHFGLGFELVSYTMGEIVVALNSVRTLVRETELVAYKAFKDEYGNVKREDVIRALNRLSSLFWIMIFKYRSGKYNS
ncbi:MAG: cobalamin adenosyltransferase [Clostridium sp.]